MSDVIQADYDALGKMSQDFTEQAANIETLLKNVNAQVDIMRNGAWLGEGAQKFCNEMGQEVCPAMTRLQQALVQAAQATKDIITELSNAETHACSQMKAVTN